MKLDAFYSALCSFFKLFEALWTCRMNRCKRDKHLFCSLSGSALCNAFRKIQDALKLIRFCCNRAEYSLVNLRNLHLLHQLQHSPVTRRRDLSLCFLMQPLNHMFGNFIGEDMCMKINCHNIRSQGPGVKFQGAGVRSQVAGGRWQRSKVRRQ